jgi:hypothetical protein
MQWLYALFGLILMVVLTPVCVWLFEDMKRKPHGGGLGPALGQLNAFFDPSVRHVEVVREQRAIDAPDDEPPL